MDLKRAWRNGFLVSLIFALPLSDLYYFQQSNLLASGNLSGKPALQSNRCAAGAGCAEFESDNIGSEQLADTSGGEANGFSTLGDINEEGLRFSKEELLQAVDLTGEDNQLITGDIKQIVDIDTDIGSIAALTYGFGDSTPYAPGHSGPWAPALFGGGGGAGSAGGFQAGSEDGAETPITNPLPDSTEESEITIPNDTLQSVPEPSSLVLMAIGTISLASLLHRRKPKPPTTHF